MTRPPAFWWLRARTPDLSARTQGVEWVQLRLNDAEDDIEIVQPAQPLRQRGYEEGDAFCSAAVGTMAGRSRTDGARHGASPIRQMNQSFVQAVPFNADASEWADVNHFDGGQLAALKYRYNAQRGVYEWVETGPLIEEQLFEASLARIIEVPGPSAAGRSGGGSIGWFRTEDPFGTVPAAARPASPVNSSPLTAYTYADGQAGACSRGTARSHRMASTAIRSTCGTLTPTTALRRRSGAQCSTSLPPGCRSRWKAVPPAIWPSSCRTPGGKEQIIVYRVRSGMNNDPSHRGAVITPTEKETGGIYYAAVQYAESYPGVWQFATDGAAGTDLCQAQAAHGGTLGQQP